MVKRKIHKSHPLHKHVREMHAAIDRFADKIADRVVHEMKEKKSEERKEHRVHKRKCTVGKRKR